MREGFYRLQYETATLNSTGVVTLQDGVITGCDRFYFMFGKYRQNNNRLEGTVTFKRHTERPGQSNAIPKQFDIRFEGVCSEDYGQFEVSCPAVPLIKGRARFTWLSSAQND